MQPTPSQPALWQSPGTQPVSSQPAPWQSPGTQPAPLQPAPSQPAPWQPPVWQPTYQGPIFQPPGPATASPRRRGPRARAAVAVALALALAGGVTAWAVSGGHSSGTAQADAPTPAIDTAPFVGALDALTAAPDVHYQSTVPGLGTVDVKVTDFGQLLGTVTEDGGVYQVLDVGGTLYVKAPSTGVPDVTSAAEASAMKGKWLTGSLVSELIGLDPASYAAPGQLAEQLAAALGTHPTLSSAGEIDGTRVVGADTSLGVLYVSATAPYHLVKLAPATASGTSSTAGSAAASILGAAAPAHAASFTTVAASDGSTSFPDDSTGSAGIAGTDSELENDVRQLATDSMDTDLSFTVNGNGSINCSDAGCSVSVTVTSSVNPGGSAKVTGGSVSADLTATVSIEGQAAGGCTGSGSLPVEGKGVLSCEVPAAGAVFASVDAQKKAQAQAQSAQQGGAEVPYQVDYNGQYYVYAVAQVNVDELEQQVTRQASTEGSLQHAYTNLLNALHRALNRTPAQVRATLSPAELSAGRDNPGRRSQYVGTSIENAVAADPAVASDPDIVHLGAASRGVPVTDFRIQVGGQRIDIDVTGSSGSSISDHLKRQYIQSGSQLLLYPSLGQGFLSEVYR